MTVPICVAAQMPPPVIVDRQRVENHGFAYHYSTDRIFCVSYFLKSVPICVTIAGVRDVLSELFCEQSLYGKGEAK